MLYQVVRPLLFRLDAERAHHLVLSGLVATEHILSTLQVAPRPWSHPALTQRLWDVTFPNPVGLAAGFDKNAQAPHVWPLLGFGFAELGTVTAEAQSGNPRPRMFRLPGDRAVINRLGFNNRGAAAVAGHLASLLRAQRATIPLGINIGKSRSASLEEAAADYQRSFRQLGALADYVVVNVSSPNTPGLRDLQQEDELSGLLETLRVENEALAKESGRPPKPLLVKIAPDLSQDGLEGVVRVARRHSAAGLVATNTTLQRTGLRTASDEAGGLSGAPLRDRATAVIRTLYRLAHPDLPIIGVGGIQSADDAYAKIRAGAALVQLYTGMVYEGPRLAYHIASGLVARLERDGLPHVRDAVGRDA